MSAVDYVASLLDPFDTTFSQPKILDGSVDRSAGVRFRITGQMQLSVDGSANFLCLMPSFANSIATKRVPDATFVSPTPYPNHVTSQVDRDNLRGLRSVSTALRISLMNTSDDNEGYWEAIRVPIDIEELTGDGNTMWCVPLNVITTKYANIANHSTYQTGRLRDIHRMQFKLNSTNRQHEFLKPVVADETKELVDQSFDMIIIKMFGRVDVQPSVIMYDVVSNQECLYEEGTALGRLMSRSPMLPGMDAILEQTRYKLPAIQIA